MENYSELIVELFMRVKLLENKIENMTAEYEERLAILEAKQAEGTVLEHAEMQIIKRNNVTDEMIDACYQYGKEAASQQKYSIYKAAEKVSIETGMNKNSAIMYIFAVKALIDGNIFKRSINANSVRIYLDKIINDYGTEGLKKALDSLRKFVNYRKNDNKTSHNIEKIISEYEARIQ